MTDRKAIALIPARGGSKGIVNKNIALLAGKPLLYYSVAAARTSGVIARIVVSSDAKDILSVASGMGAETLLRPADLATDTAKTDDVVGHFIDQLKLDANMPIILLQPTSPLRTGHDIAEALRLWQTKAPECLISVFEPPEHPAKSFWTDDNGFLVGIAGEDAPFSPRQSLPKAYLPNGAIYIFSARAFRAGNCIPRRGLFPFVMDASASVDIDTMEDMRRAERCIQERAE